MFAGGAAHKNLLGRSYGYMVLLYARLRRYVPAGLLMNRRSAKGEFQMSKKFVRFAAILAITVGFVGNTSVAGAARRPSPSATNARPVDIPALGIPETSSSVVQFVHFVTAENLTGGSDQATFIDHPLTNDNPDAIIFVTPNWNPGGVGGTYNNHNIGVAYRENKWIIYNQDSALMPVGAAFNVMIPAPGTTVFVHTATVGNRADDYTIIDNPQTNSNPDAIFFITPNWNPGGGVGVDANFPIGVFYSDIVSKGAIFNQNGSGNPIPLDAAFNVFVPPVGAGVFVHIATAGNSIGDYTIIDNPFTNSHPDAILFVTPNWEPGGACGCVYANFPIGVFYANSVYKWAIFNQDFGTIPEGAAFNVYIYTNRLYLPLILR
jgi:hypothetical protein